MGGCGGGRNDEGGNTGNHSWDIGRNGEAGVDKAGTEVAGGGISVIKFTGEEVNYGPPHIWFVTE